MSTATATMKQCKTCQKTKDAEEFRRAKANKDGLRSRCRSCDEAEAQRRQLPPGPEAFTPDHVTVHRHKKMGRPDSLRVTYWQGPTSFTEWVCFHHDGIAREKAMAWWRRRFGDPVPTVDEAMADMELSAKVLALTKEITIEIIDGRATITRHELTTHE